MTNQLITHRLLIDIIDHRLGGQQGLLISSNHEDQVLIKKQANKQKKKQSSP